MKRIIFILMMVVLAVHVNGQTAKPFVLTGNVTDYLRSDAKMIYLKYNQNGKEKLDSSAIKNGNYSFKGSVLYPVKAILQLKVVDSIEAYYKATGLLKNYAFEFYLEGGKLNASSPATLNKTIIKGSKTNAEMVWLKERIAPFYAKSNEIYTSEGKKAYESKDSTAIAVYDKKSRYIQKQIDSTKKDFLFNHPQSGMALDMLQEYTRSFLDPVEVAPLYKKLLPALLMSDNGKAYAKRIEKSKETAKGVLAPDFTLKDRNGNNITFSSQKGKLVLLDFWGSWCRPCRMTHPHLMKLYTAYKDKGFEIFGVSNELNTPAENYERWVKAIDEDGITWLNVINDKDKTDKVDNILTKYSVNAFPTKLLIDKNGVIIKRFVGNTPDNEVELDMLIKKYLGGE